MANSQLLVAAIDFGTTYSGYAFSFRHEFEQNPLNIVANTAWICSSGQSMLSLKTPTTVLLNPDQTFHSFGFEAEDKYMELADEGEHEPWYYFRRFKMLLYKKMIVSRNVTIEDAMGKPVKAILVFSLAIEYIKDHFLSIVNDRGIDVTNDDIMWVLTVPAIWEEPAKQFMREAAVMAGIPSDQLKLVLEPEAASVLCKSLPLERYGAGQEAASFSSFRAGTRYIVLDLGGGTVDVTLHEVKGDGTLKEINKASGGAWGGTRVDSAYMEMFDRIFGVDIMKSYRQREKLEDLEMQRNFELKKRGIQNNTATVKITIPVALLEFVHEETGTYPQEFIQNSMGDDVILKRNQLLIKGHVIGEMYKESINGIIAHVKGIIHDPKVEKVDKILIVGGFSACMLVSDAIKEAFAGVQIVVPPEPELAVLKGAVIFGHSPREIASRVVHHTYGVAVRSVFYPGVHPEENREVIQDTVYCKNAFDKFFSAGDEVGNDETIVREYKVSDPNRPMEIAFYASERPYPILVTEQGCTKIGDIVIEQPIGGWRKNSALQVELGLGGSEFTVKVTELKTQLQQEAKFDFLSAN